MFARQTIGIREVDDQVWLVSFLEYDLGYLDKKKDRVKPGPSPFMPDKVLTMCPAQGVTHVTCRFRDKFAAEFRLFLPKSDASFVAAVQT